MISLRIYVFARSRDVSFIPGVCVRLYAYARIQKHTRFKNAKRIRAREVYLFPFTVLTLQFPSLALSCLFFSLNTPSQLFHSFHRHLLLKLLKYIIKDVHIAARRKSEITPRNRN